MLNSFVGATNLYTFEKILEDFQQRLTQYTKYYAGYPENLNFDYNSLLIFLEYHLNNAGDPFVPGDFGLQSKEFEQECISWFAQLYELPEYWGYVTSGGTEGNLYGLFLGRTLYPDGILYSSKDSHYSVPKAAHLLRISHCTINSQPNGEIEYEHLEQELSKRKNQSAILNLNFGTTMKGAVDNIDRVIGILEKLDIRFYIHCDGALGGMLLPFIEGAPKISFKNYPIGSIAVSGHKFIGSPIPYGIVLTRAEYLEKIGQVIEYIGSKDTTITGSRSGLTPLLLWYALKTRSQHFELEVSTCLRNAQYLYNRLTKIGNPSLLNNFSTTVVFEKPARETCRKWQLATEGSLAHVVVMQHLSIQKIDELIKDLSMEKLSNQVIHYLFQEQVEKTPEKIALVMGHLELTYSEVNQWANKFAHTLRNLGVGLETPVSICLRRSPEAIVAILGILKAGGAYVPVDPDFPEARKQYMIEDSGCGVLITEKSLLNSLTDFKGRILLVDDESLSQQDSSNPDIPVTPDSLMYILYTSGSTGTPKGVCGIHRATVNRCIWMWNQYPFTENEVCCHKTTLNFVDSIWEIFGPLLKGVKVVILPHSSSTNPQEMIGLLQDAKVTRIILVPSLLEALLNTRPDLGEALRDLKIWTVSGERLTQNLLQKFRASVSHGILLNLYGSTEVAGDITWAEFAGNIANLELDVPIGQPILNAEIHILDENLQPVGLGEVGELWVGGVVLARGYHKKPQETKARFIPNPFSSNGILFKTGDLVTTDNNGLLYYVGRVDNQVKIRGFRVELEEIEKVLAQFHPEISNVTVLIQEDEQASETKQLVAFVVPSTVNVDAMKQYALSQLSHYMVPARIVAVDELPLTPNGKVDRQTLSSMSGWRFRVIDSEKLPQTETEKLLADIWQQMFLVSPVSREDDFFLLGGNSLSVLSFLEKLNQEFQVRIPLTNFVNEPSLASLARFFDEAKQLRYSPVVEVRLSDVELIPFEEKYLEQTTTLVSESFTKRSPLELALAIKKEEFSVFANRVCKQCLPEGLSYIAVDKISGNVLGFCLSEDFASSLAMKFEIPEFFKPIFALLDSLDQMYIKSYGEVKKGEIVYVFMSGMSDHVNGTAIVLALEKKILEVAASLNYERAVTTCTNSVTAYIAQELEYQRRFTVQYESFEFEGRRVFSQVPAPHKEAVLFEKVLENTNN
ncbi:histidine decarboxylase [Nostoc sp. FACHB-133]|uniref:histidine decarboxylase n=1 Tax=Nostoc sp. FACHB-133 TaxID=2692835 RepID=UPI0016882422|nr:histidine decarboxylase [Nostoc sp. FACHB-133]MBD2527540.1 histidine decarboxylase [Nostoc sp. FACHB-133]